MMQCVYGIVWFDKKDLKVYFKCCEEVKECDYCKLGKEFDLFMVNFEVG